MGKFESMLGVEFELIAQTTSHDTADAMGNSGVHVVSTVTLIGLIEQCCGQSIVSILPPGYVSVGSLVSNFIENG